MPTAASPLTHVALLIPDSKSPIKVFNESLLKANSKSGEISCYLAKSPVS